MLANILFGTTYYGQMMKMCAHFYQVYLTLKVDYTNPIRIQIYLSSGYNTNSIYFIKSVINSICIYEMFSAVQVKTFYMKIKCY